VHVPLADGTLVNMRLVLLQLHLILPCAVWWRCM
jgi:hypothetical protein